MFTTTGRIKLRIKKKSPSSNGMPEGLHPVFLTLSVSMPESLPREFPAVFPRAERFRIGRSELISSRKPLFRVSSLAGCCRADLAYEIFEISNCLIETVSRINQL